MINNSPDKFLSEYSKYSNIILSFNCNNRLIIYEDQNFKKWILKISDIRNSNQISGILLQDKMSFKKLSPPILRNSNDELYTVIDQSVGFVQKFIVNSSNYLSNIRKILQAIDSLHLEMKYEYINFKNNISTTNNFNNNIKIIKDSVFDKYILKKKSFAKKFKDELNKPIFLDRQLIHGDLRPENVLTVDNSIFFIDFEYCRLGYTEVEKLKFHLLYSINNKLPFYEIMNSYSHSSIVLLAKDILNNSYLEKNWNRIAKNYREKTVAEHLYLLNFVDSYFRRCDINGIHM
ncbi:hypothetical protein BZK37_06765 [Enterococcus casseliflavus]|nr:hypothetical protein BZK37_06765 [Enterococcus casseliflavus]